MSKIERRLENVRFYLLNAQRFKNFLNSHAYFSEYLVNYVMTNTYKAAGNCLEIMILEALEE